MSKISKLTRLAQIGGVDTGPRERWQHDPRRLVPRDASGRVTAWAARPGSLDKMLDAGVICRARWEAGRAFMLAWHDAALPSPVTQSYNPQHAGKSRKGHRQLHSRNDWQEQRYEDWRGAVRCVGKIDIAPLIRIICEDGRPETQAELDQIITALGRLANYYGTA